MTDLSKDELFRILSNARRRYIIYHLHNAGQEMSLKDLATIIAAEENETEIGDVTDDDRQRVYISLYQTHLPKLEESGIIEYDEERRTVTLTTETVQDGFFWMDSDGERSWLVYYAALGIVAWVAIIVVAAGVAAFLSWTIVALFVSLGLVLLVAAQYLTEERTNRADSFDNLIE